MRTPIDEQLRREAARLRFRFGCEHCAYFDPQDRQCSEGYPNDAHREVSLELSSALFFCKRFELG